MVYGREGLANSYAVDAGGAITMPLIGAVHARGLTPAELAQAIAVELRNGYIREPYVAAEVEALPPVLHSWRGGSARPVSPTCPT